jgi:hypothetical protein
MEPAVCRASSSRTALQVIVIMEIVTGWTIQWTVTVSHEPSTIRDALTILGVWHTHKV